MKDIHSQKDYISKINRIREHHIDELMQTIEVQEIVETFEPAFKAPWYQRVWKFISCRNNLKKALGIVVTISEFMDSDVTTPQQLVMKYVIPKLRGK